MSKFSENKDMVLVFLFLIIGIIIAVALGQLFHDKTAETTVETRVFTQEDSIAAEAIYEDIWVIPSNKDEDYL